jgi:hypothetical protein
MDVKANEMAGGAGSVLAGRIVVESGLSWLAGEMAVNVAGLACCCLLVGTG